MPKVRAKSRARQCRFREQRNCGRKSIEIRAACEGVVQGLYALRSDIVCSAWCQQSPTSNTVAYKVRGHHSPTPQQDSGTGLGSSLTEYDKREPSAAWIAPDTLRSRPDSRGRCGVLVGTLSRGRHEDQSRNRAGRPGAGEEALKGPPDSL